MAKVRAYKIAEELGLDRDEFLERASALGIELRSHLVGLDEEQVETLRRRLGAAGRGDREEKRVGSTVIRRRRKKAAPVEVAEPAPAETEEPVAAEREPSPEPAPTVEPEPAVAQPAPAVAAVSRPGEAPARMPQPAPPSSPARVAEQPAARKLTRRKVLEGVALKEQEQLSRTMRGNVQQRLERRRLIVERQSRLQSGRRRTVPQPRRPSAPGPRKLEIKLSGPLTFPELSKLLGLKVRELIRSARALDAEVDRDALIGLETAVLLAEEAGFSVQRVEKSLEQTVQVVREASSEDQELRPPIVTVMGHVDHGKTTLLDQIRQSNVVEGEAGGITQHIGAYQVLAGGSVITFIDTPGHAAFTQMRARGAQITDIAVLVVAADDGIMPQTVEAISHARAAEVPIIVAVNKIDRPDANPQKVKQVLLEHELVPEEFGGDVICVEISAKEGTNVDKLLEMLVLQAEVLELRARTKGPARATVIEAQLDRGRGPIATVLVIEGTLRTGDAVVIGMVYGRVRTLINDQGTEIKSAGPSAPIQIIGLSGVPEAGQEVVVVKDERAAKALVEQRLSEQRREQSQSAVSPLPADAEEIFAPLGGDDKKELRLVIKTDVRGTMEAVTDAVSELANEEVRINIIHSGVGAVTESDVMLASASEAIVLGFHIRPDPAARKLAEREGVSIRTFDIVYELLDDAKAMMLGLLPPLLVEQISGHAEVRQLFVIPRQGTIAGCYVAEGSIRRNQLIRVLRDGVPIYSGKLASLRRFKDDVRDVQSPMECGIKIENFDDMKVGDLLESYVIEETKRTS